MLTKWVTKVILLLVSILTTATLAHVVRSGNNNGARKLFGGYRITPKQCRASKTLPMSDPRATGLTICMFNHECAQRNGEVVGACMDGFLFGACCQIPNFDTVQTTLINNAQNGYYQQKLHNRIKDKVDEQSNAQNTQIYQNILPQYNTDTKDELNTDSAAQPTNSYGTLHQPAATVHAAAENYMTSAANFHVNKDSVNVSSHSSSSSNTDDLLLQALHTFAPHDADRISYSTEVPMKITSALVEHTSSESVSFEDEYQVSKIPIKLMEKPQTTTISSDDVLNYGQQIGLLHDSSDFTHSDITHSDAEAILLETSSISSSQSNQIAQQPNDTQNKYVLVQTITNNNKKTEIPSTTSSALTSTHVDSIESIILQLNNSNPGPVYDVEPASANNNYATFTSTMRPTIESTSKVSATKVGQNAQTKPEPVHHFLNEHTLPAFSYADTSGSEHDTSEFNKMPAQGIAYPVDMSLFDEEGLMTTHKQTISAPTKKPQLPYESLITAQNYNTLKPIQNSQVPEEITVSSHTTKVQEQLLSTLTKPANNLISSSNQYATNSNILISSSSMRPISPSRKPKPPVYRPITAPPDISNMSHKKTTSSQSLKQTTSTAAPVRIQQPSNTYEIDPVFENVPLVQTTLLQGAFSTEPNKQESQELLYENEDTHMYLVNSYAQNTKVAEASQSSTLKPSEEQATRKPISTSYITGPTSPRPPTTFVYDDNDKVPPLLYADDKLDSFLQSTADTYVSPTYQTPVFISSATPIHIQRPHPSLYNNLKAPGFVKIQATLRPPVPTILITPKPTVLTSSSTQKLSSLYNDNEFAVTTTPYPPVTQTSSISTLSSISQIYNQLLTRRPGDGDYSTSSSTTSSIIANDPVEFNEHPAYTQSTTEAVFSVPNDDKPAFPGYYGPTPTYPPFVIPDSEKVDSAVEEETYTSPNDFADFPPVRNPNLNISTGSSDATSDLELSTPIFVEDAVLKNKMNTLVHKLAESLHGNFEALSDLIDNSSSETNQAVAQPTTITVTRRTTTRRPVNTKTKVSTTKPPKQSTKAPIRRTTIATTRRTTVTRRPTTSTTKKGPTRKSTRKPTRKTTTTTAASLVDDVVDEEDEEDVNPSANEVQQSGQVGTKRKIQCGMRPLVKSGRIVGGKGANFGAFPWQVLVRESTWIGFFVKNKCGGVLINDRYVITAAHCKPGFLGSLVAVMGEFDITGELESRRAVTKNVRRVIVHNQYDPATFENDLALLELESPVQFDMHIVPICMPPDNSDFTGRMATVTGWGRLKYGGGVPSVLQEVQVPIIENSVCQEMFHTAGHNKKILNSFLCAGYANGQKDSCEGDSGGPLVLQRPDGRYELAGTVSHGIKCAAPYLPGVYMRTTFYKPWLRSVTGVK